MSFWRFTTFCFWKFGHVVKKIWSVSHRRILEINCTGLQYLSLRILRIPLDFYPSQLERRFSLLRHICYHLYCLYLFSSIHSLNCIFLWWCFWPPISAHFIHRRMNSCEISIYILVVIKCRVIDWSIKLVCYTFSLVRNFTCLPLLFRSCLFSWSWSVLLKSLRFAF